MTEGVIKRARVSRAFWRAKDRDALAQELIDRGWLLEAIGSRTVCGLVRRYTVEAMAPRYLTEAAQ